MKVPPLPENFDKWTGEAKREHFTKLLAYDLLMYIKQKEKRK